LLGATLQGGSLLASLNEALAADTDFDLGAWLPGGVTDGLVLGVEPIGCHRGRSNP